MNINNKYPNYIALASVALFLSASIGVADDDKIDSYQQNTLFNPSDNQLPVESPGSVYTYDEMVNKSIGEAMDEQTGRIESMMFVNKKKTVKDGNPSRKPETGEILADDDDC